MLKRLLEFRLFCFKIQDEPGFENLKKGEDGWETFEELQKILQISSEVTRKMQAEDLLVTDFIYLWISMKFELSKRATQSQFAKSLLECIEKRGEQIFNNKVIITGWFLDKSLYLLNEMNNDESKKQTARDIIKVVSRKRNTLDQTQNSAEVTMEIDVDEQETMEKTDSFDKLLQSLGNSKSRSSLRSNRPESSLIDREIAAYEKFPAPTQRCNSITWWKEHQEKCPLLAPIAFTIISAPTTEVTVERLFSHLKYRHRLVIIPLFPSYLQL